MFLFFLNFTNLPPYDRVDFESHKPFFGSLKETLGKGILFLSKFLKKIFALLIFLNVKKLLPRFFLEEIIFLSLMISAKPDPTKISFLFFGSISFISFKTF